MSSYEFKNLDDDELRNRVLNALDTIEQQTRGNGDHSTSKRDPPSGSIGEALLALKALFGADGVDASKAEALESPEIPKIGKDAEGWMSKSAADRESDTKDVELAGDSKGWM